ncbi:hypothetical protein BGZ58_001254 [Dissophora ornata]|nr:hypothetical protein BGZ58_001254 [Dissophora ornata]
MNCTTWESAPVFQRELDAETVLALVPVGRFSPSELWGIVLLAEPVKGGGARAGTGVACEQAREFAWKYHHFMVISETDLTFSDSWRCLDNQSSLFTSPQQQQKEYPKQRSLPTVSTSLAPTPQNAYRSAVTAVEEDDSDDEYWGQYGDVEDSPTEESAHSGSTPFTRGFTMTVEEEEEDDDDEYWRKYGEAQGEEQDESDKKSKTTDEDPSSEVVAVRSFVDHDPRHVMPTDVTGSESGRILACVDDRAPRALSTLVAPVAAMPVPGQVNPTTLAMLLERLVAHNDDPSPDNDVGGTGNKDKDDAGEADVSLPLEEQVPRFTDNLPSSSSSPSSALSWSSSAGSRSRSQSLSTSISSTSTCTTATTITTSIKSATIAQDDSGAQTMSSVSSTSPGSAVSCTDSAFHEYCSPSIIAPDEFRKETKAEGAAAAAEPSASSTTATKESVRQSLQSAVRKASVSGLSKTELLEMLSVIYERQEQIIQA